MIRLYIPDTPTIEELTPYLRCISETGICSNNGPLVQELEDAFSQRLGCATARAVSNGTLAVELALRALGLPRGSAVLIPSVTFCATGLAALNAGLRPVICDVDPVTWQLTPEIARAYSTGVQAVVPVAAFGSSVCIDEWEEFFDETSIPVVIDAAAAIMTQRVSHHPALTTCFSLHATKPIMAGEGGLVCGAGAAEAGRLAAMGCTNARMSEYHAAVGLCSLSRVQRDACGPIYDMYRRAAVGAESITTSHGVCNVELPIGLLAATVQQHFSTLRIETKRWYTPYLHERSDFARYLLGEYPVASYLSSQLLGLPFHRFLSAKDVTEVTAGLRSILAPNPKEVV